MDRGRERVLRTAARYLGVRADRAKQDAELARLLNAAYGEMLAAAAPRFALRREAARTAEGVFAFEGLPPVKSRDLCRLFAGCGEGVALLATLGMALELRVRRLMVTEPALAAAVSACGSAYIDVYIDRELERETGERGIALTPRFSPGYGDAPLSLQPALLRLLDGERLGVHLTAGLLMVPEKSVTALAAIVPRHEAAAPGTDGAGVRDEADCGGCPKGDCPYRKETGTDA